MRILLIATIFLVAGCDSNLFCYQSRGCSIRGDSQPLPPVVSDGDPSGIAEGVQSDNH